MEHLVVWEEGGVMKTRGLIKNMKWTEAQTEHIYNLHVVNPIRMLETCIHCSQ